ncbi:MAG: transposase [Pseudonocardiaceae bacterium]
MSTVAGVTLHRVASPVPSIQAGPRTLVTFRRKATNSMLADLIDHVIGTDCHRDANTAAITDRLGALLGSLTVSTNSTGYRAHLEWAREHAPGRRVWAVEGAGCYGAGLTEYLRQNREWVVEVDRPKRSPRKAGVKSDEVDALRAARDALAAKRLAEPRKRGDLEAVRVLKTSRKQAVQTSAASVTRLKALVVKAPEGLRKRLRGLPASQLLATCSALREQPSQSIEWNATVVAMKMIARRARAAAEDEVALSKRLAALVKTQAPQALLAEPGVGIVVASELLSAWSHQGRFHSEAAFAKVAGVAPVEASSGRVVRHRLSRSGDRQLNAALHTVVLTRWRQEAKTQAYVARRQAEGKSDREIRRCLKRYVARHLYRVMERSA